MDGNMIDEVTRLALSDNGAVVRIEFQEAGRSRYIDIGAQALHALIPGLLAVSSPQGEVVPAFLVSGFQARGGPDNTLLLSLDLGNASRMTLALPAHLAGELWSDVAFSSWASSANRDRH